MVDLAADIRGCGAAARVLLKAALDERAHFGAQGRELRQRLSGGLQYAAVVAPGGAAGEHLHGRGAQGPDVGRAVGAAVEALGAHICPRAARHAAGIGEAEARIDADAEVRHQIVAVVVEHYVVGLDVLVDDVVLVQVFQSGGHIVEQMDYVLLVHAAGEGRAGAVLAVLHHQIGLALADVVAGGRQEVGVLHVEDSGELALEVLQAVGVHLRCGGVDFQRHHEAAGLGVARFPHFGGGAAAKGLYELVAAVE